MTSVPALRLQSLGIRFGGLKAVWDLSLDIPKDSIFGLIGPNGAGKTTVFNLLTGIHPPAGGEIIAFGKSLVDLRPYEIARQGIVRTFQNIRLFKDLSVLENVLVAIDNNPSYQRFGVVRSILRTPLVLRVEAQKVDAARAFLEIFGLNARERELARNLCYGDQRRLEIARALAVGAKLLLLDEPAAGMNATETEALMRAIQDIRTRFGLTILLIEHDMRLVMGTCERIAVLDHGVKIAEGTPLEIRGNPRVIEAYLGKAATHV